jgi:hypothetical protein
MASITSISSVPIATSYTIRLWEGFFVPVTKMHGPGECRLVRPRPVNSGAVGLAKPAPVTTGGILPIFEFCNTFSVRVRAGV